MRSAKNEAAYKALLGKFTKSELATLMGVSRQAMTKLKSIPPGRVKALSQATGIPPQEILPELPEQPY